MFKNMFFPGAEKKYFYRQISTLLLAGFSLSGALEHMDKNLSCLPAGVMSSLKKDIAEGKTLACAMAIFVPGVFTHFERGVVEAGEASGNLPESLARLAENFEFLSSVRSRVVAGLAYPVILLHLGVVIPAVPLLFTLGIGPFLLRVLPFLAVLYGLLFGAIFLYRMSNRSILLSESRDRMLLSVPYLGKFIHKIEVIRFLHSFVALYIAGVGIARAVELAGETTGNTFIRQDIKSLIPLLKRGEKLSDVLSGRGWVPGVVCDMIKTGEVSGTMDETLDRVSLYLKEETDSAVEKFLKILPVAAYLVVAVYIGYIVISFFSGYLKLINSFF